MTILDDHAQTLAPIFSDAVPSGRAAPPPEPPPREWTWLNWSFSLLVAPIAVVAMAFALAQVGRGVSGSLFDLLYYGPAAAAALTLFFAFFLATYRYGIAVWVIGWALVLADLVALAVLF